MHFKLMMYVELGIKFHKLEYHKYLVVPCDKY